MEGYTKGELKVEHDDTALASYIITPKQAEEESGFIAECSWTCGVEVEEARANAERMTLCWNQHDKLVEALELILPMAKGYAYTHDVGSNKKYIEIAKQALKG